MIAIWKKELKSYFHSIIGYLYIGVILFFTGIYFTIYNLINGLPYISYTLSSILMTFLIVTPLLTMRIMSEEKKMKTDQLLFTSPVSPGKILIGKYLSMLTVLAIPMGVIALYPLIMSSFGEVPFGEAYTAIFGFFLFGAACLAIGLFVSALTENQIIAALITFAILLFGFLLAGIISVLAAGNTWLSNIASIFDLATRLSTLMDGVLDLTCIIYFLTIVFLFLFFTYELIQKRKYHVSARGVKTRVFSIGFIIVVLLVSGGVNYFVLTLPTTMTQIDVTNTHLYSITQPTKDLVSSLEEDVTIYVLENETVADDIVQQILGRYEDLSSHIKIEYRDMETYPNFAAQYTLDTLSSNSLIVVCKEKSKAIDYSMLFESQFDYGTYSSVATGFDGEGQITSAISYVLSEEQPKMYAIQGHNEAEVSQRLSSRLAKANIDVETMQLLNYEKIPEDAQCIFIFAPTVDFSQEDAKKVVDYLKGGGHALIITSWTQEELPNFEGVLEEYGVHLKKGIVAEGDSSAYYQNPFYLLPNVLANEMTYSIMNRYIFMPYAQAISIEEDVRSSLSIESLLTTTEKAYIKENMGEAETYEKEEGDEEGSFPIGVLITEDLGDKTTRIVHFTTENMLTDHVDDTVSGANMELLMNGITSMVDNTSPISIPVKQYNVSQNIVNTFTALTLGGILTIFIPLALLITGIIVWARRRKK